MKNSKRILAAVFALVMALSMVVPAFAATVKVTSVTVGHTSLKLIPGKSYSEKVTVKPTNATNKAVTWKSSNTKIATVTQAGKITAKAKGTATITVTAKDGSGKKATCKVTVGKPVTSVKLNATAKTLYTGKTFTLKPTFAPTDAVNKLVLWSSSNTKVATVSSSGVVTAKAKGTATITCTTRDGSGKKATCKITVVQSVTSVKLDRTAINAAKYGVNYKITPTIAPTNAYKKTVTWTSSNTKVAVVSKTGVVSTKAYGTATITCTAADGSGKKATCKVTVSNPAVSVALNKTAINSVTIGAKYTLKATVKPAKATVKWTSSNTAVATVDSKGVVTTKNNGKSTITCTISYGGTVKKATCAVTIRVQVQSVKLNSVSFNTKEIGATYQLKATIAPSNAGVKTVTWSTSDKNVATVSANGLVTATGYGKADITCTAMDKKTAVCTVKVIANVEDITLSETEITSEKIGVQYTVKANLYPTYAISTAKWITSDSSVATVENGVITVRGNGTAIITARADDMEADCKIIVKAPLETLTLDKEAIYCDNIGSKYKIYPNTKPASNGVYSFNWSSSDEAVATVDEQGNVTITGNGLATITCECEGKTAACTVSVVQGVESVTLDKNVIKNVKVGDQVTLKATVLPENATDTTVIWSTTNKKVATVENGVVTFNDIGYAIITAHVGEKYAECEVYVKNDIIPVNYNKYYEEYFKSNNFTMSGSGTVTADDIKGVAGELLDDDTIKIIDEIGSITVNGTVAVSPKNVYGKVNTTSLNNYINKNVIPLIEDSGVDLGTLLESIIKKIKLAGISAYKNDEGIFAVIETEKISVLLKSYYGVYLPLQDLLTSDIIDFRKLADSLLNFEYLGTKTETINSEECTGEVFLTDDKLMVTMYFDKDGKLVYSRLEDLLIKITDVKATVNPSEFTFDKKSYLEFDIASLME